MKRPIAFLCTALLLPSAAALADDATYTPTSLTAVQIVERARHATGALQPGAYKIVERWHGGGLDSTTTTYVQGADTLSTEVRGPFTTSWGAYHGQSWESNENGIVTLDADFRDADDPDANAVAHAEDSTSGVTVLGMTAGANPAYALDVNPIGGEHQIRYYDAATYHLTRVVTWATDRLKHTITYDDYRTAFGKTNAYHRHYSDGRADNESDGTVVSVTKIANPPSLEIPAGKSLFTFASADPVVLPTTFDRGVAMVRVTIDGRGLDFILDSGASGIFLDPGVARQLNLPLYGKVSGTIGGNVDQSQTIVPDMKIGDLDVKNAVINVAPITEQHQTARAVGLLGYDFFASAIVGIDFKNATVTVFPHGSSPTRDVVTRVPVELDDGIPRAPVSFENVPGKFLIDTGAAGTLVYQRYFRALPNRSNFGGTEQLGFIGGDVPASKYTIYNLNFGGVMFKNAAVVVPQTSLADLFAYDGIIGRDVLSAYTLYFDYAGQAIYVKYDE